MSQGHFHAWSIASVDGGLVNCKTAKSLLLPLLERGASPVDQVPDLQDAAWMVDATANLQSIYVPPSTFADLALTKFSDVTHPLQHGAKRVDFVVDQYSRVSIKSCERSRYAM